MDTNGIEAAQESNQIFDKDLSYVTSHKHPCRSGDYARAMYYPREDTEEKFAFRCKTPLKQMMFLFDKEYYKKCSGKDQPEDHELLWVRCGMRIGSKDPALSKKGMFSGGVAVKNAGREFGQFQTFYRVGEYITCPVKHTIGNESVAVMIGPSAWVPVYDNDLINEIHGDNPHGEYIFRIVKNEYEQKCNGNIVLKYVPLPKKKGDAKSYVQTGGAVLPGVPRIVVVASSVADELNAPGNQYIRKQIQENLEFLPVDLPFSGLDYIDVSEIASYCKHQYNKAYRNGQILVRQKKEEIKGNFPLDIKDKNGIPVSCEFILGNRDVDVIIITRIGAPFLEL